MSTQELAEVTRLLSLFEFFAGLPTASLRRIAALRHEETAEGGTTIFSEGDRGDKFYLITEGAVRNLAHDSGHGRGGARHSAARRLLRRDGAPG